MTWWSAIFATAVVIFPLMYRTARGAFESFDETLAYSGQTLGLSNTYIFWHIRMPCCRQGILAGTVLAFARALGEYGATSMIAGYSPRQDRHHLHHGLPALADQHDALAMKWVMVNLSISAVVLLTVNMLERRDFLVSGGKRTGDGLSLLVEIEKQLGNFHLDVRFQAETETLALLGGLRLRQEHDPQMHRGDHDPGSGGGSC